MEAGALRPGRLLAFFVAVGLVAGWAADANAIFFNLHGLSPSQNNSYHLVAGGFTVNISPSNLQGNFTSSATTFGFDTIGTGDDPALIDGGAGSAESFIFTVSPSALVESILISSFDSIDQGTLLIKGGSTMTLAGGLNPVGIVATSTSGNILSWTGDKLQGGGRGFSVDGFTVTPLINNSYLAGDYDGNGRVDAADYIVWRDGMGQSYTQSDYNTWRSHFGQTISGSGAATDVSAVPEPTSIAAVVLAGTVGVLLRPMKWHAVFAHERLGCS